MMWRNRNRSDHRIRNALLLVAVLLCMTSVATAKEITLTYAPSEKPMRYKMEVTQEVHMQGMEVTMNQTGVAELTYLGKSEDGGAKISVHFSNMENSMMQGSKIVEQDPKLDDKKLDAFLSPRGEVMKVEPQSYLSDEVTEMARNLIENFFAYMPESKIKDGGTWTQKIQKESESKDIDGPELEGEIEYTLEDFEKRDGKEVVKIFGEGTLKINAMTPMGIYTGKVEGETELYVAVEGGYVVECKSSATVTGEIGDGLEVDRVERFQCKLQQD